MKRLCIDRLLYSDSKLHRDLYRQQAQMPGAPDRAIALRNRQWPNGKVLTVAFIGGTDAQRTFVRSKAPQWSSYGNISFEFKAALPAHVRIGFDESDGSWSYIGLDNHEIPPTSPTMNLGWLDQDVVLHEFGHCLGLAHEHQNPEGGIQWNEAAVIADLSGPPNYWDEETIRWNVLRKYSSDQVMGTAFDSKSIMLYSFPPEWTTNGFNAGWNEDISVKDAEFIGSSRMYPKALTPTVLQLPVLSSKAAAIVPSGEVDEYAVEVVTPGVHVFETMGTTNVAMSLFRGTTLMQTNDDSGSGLNARIEVHLAAGRYRLLVRHYLMAGRGAYRVIAWT